MDLRCDFCGTKVLAGWEIFLSGPKPSLAALEAWDSIPPLFISKENVGFLTWIKSKTQNCSLVCKKCFEERFAEMTENGDDSPLPPLAEEIRNKIEYGELAKKYPEVEKLISLGKKKGFLTYDEVNDILPPNIVSSDQIDEVMMMFAEMNIEIVDDTQSVETQKQESTEIVEELTVEDVFERRIAERIKTDPEIAKSINAIYQFNITGKQGGIWTVDLTADLAAIYKGESGKAQCIVEIADQDWLGMLTGRLNGRKLFLSGRLKIAGDMNLAMKLEKITGW